MAIVWRELAERAGVKRADLDTKYNKVRRPPPLPHTPCTHACTACLHWCTFGRRLHVASRTRKMCSRTCVRCARTNRPASASCLLALRTLQIDVLSPASGHVQRVSEHELVDRGVVARKNARPAGKRGPKKQKVSTPRVACAGTPIARCKQART